MSGPWDWSSSIQYLLSCYRSMSIAFVSLSTFAFIQISIAIWISIFCCSRAWTVDWDEVKLKLLGYPNHSPNVLIAINCFLMTDEEVDDAVVCYGLALLSFRSGFRTCGSPSSPKIDWILYSPNPCIGNYYPSPWDILLFDTWLSTLLRTFHLCDDGLATFRSIIWMVLLPMST